MLGNIFEVIDTKPKLLSIGRDLGVCGIISLENGFGF
jgi:hypothetical protein